MTMNNYPNQGYVVQQGGIYQGQQTLSQTPLVNPQTNYVQQLNQPGQQVIMTNQGQQYIVQQPGQQVAYQPVTQPVVVQQQPVSVPVLATQPTQAVQYVFVTDPMQELAASTSALIRQEPDHVEALTGCDTPNRYHIFIQTPFGLKYMFKCREVSDCLSRMCCSTSCRSFHLNFNLVTSMTEYYGTETRTFLRLKKPCAIVCTPKLIVEHYNNHTLYGKIQKASCQLDPEMDVYDNNDNLRYQIKTDCCQAGLCLGAACAKMSEVVFKILERGKVVGELTKVPADIHEFLTTADTYEVIFPTNASVNDKLLIIVSSLLIDYEYFETSILEEERENRKKYGGYRGYGGRPHGHGGRRGHW